MTTEERNRSIFTLNSLASIKYSHLRLCDASFQVCALSEETHRIISLFKTSSKVGMNRYI